jgi:hypothetical protein
MSAKETRFVPAYWQRRMDRLRKGRAILADQEEGTQGNDYSGTKHPREDSIVTTLEQIHNDIRGAAEAQQAEWIRDASKKDRRFRLDIAAIVVAALGAGILWAQQTIMKGQLDEMQGEQRPWLSITGNPTVTEPLSSDPNGLRITITFLLKNSGKNPAVNAFVNLEASVSRRPDIAWQKGVCNRLSNELGVSIFSGDQANLGEVTYVGSAELNELSKRFPKGGAIASPFIIACVVYRDSIDGQWHHTPYAYRLDMNRDALKPDRGCCAIILSDLPIDGTRLVLPQWPVNVMLPD